VADVLVLPSAPPLVHRVAERDARVGIGESERAPGAEVSEGTRVRAEPASTPASTRRSAQMALIAFPTE